MQLGMPPDTPIIMDLSFLGKPFYRGLQRRRRLAEAVRTGSSTSCPGSSARSPQLEDIDIDGRSVLGIYRNYRAAARANSCPRTRTAWRTCLQAAVRIALEYRLDLMNTRAQLYDAWRQIRVTANALKGVLNVALTNQVYTAPTPPTRSPSSARPSSSAWCSTPSCPWSG